ncbi:hypothetical protein C1H46_030202 [Malus baccata]|uniref:Uncharacterized protein n=1 Tax=Malus baccata TaxID=106549 RepID=A0A540LCS3_MALBA|nr:hypothetical protein C1H46_030202 [Malus baccata]
MVFFATGVQQPKVSSLMGFIPSCSIFPIALSYGGMDDDYNTFKLMSSHIRVEESYLQHRLSFLKKEENISAQSYMLMGTTDPTGTLEKNKVCVLLYVQFLPFF